LNTSLTDPLTPVKVIDTNWSAFKILRVGNQLLLGENWGWLEVFDINNSNITSSHKFKEGGMYICDILAIDDTHYLLAAQRGLLKTSKDQLIKHYFNGECVLSLCHITEAIYLLGFDDKLIVWDEKTD
jgi:hypothetical protein